jgi:hypothetical protein
MTNATHHFNIHWDFANSEPWNENTKRIQRVRLSHDRVEMNVSDNIQDGHPKGIPEVLLTHDADAWVPGVSVEVVTVSENHEDPC